MKQKPPPNLGPRGRRFWKSMEQIEADTDTAFVATELELVVSICRIVDEIDDLEASIGRDGTTTTGARGQSVVNPALSQALSHRLALGRLLGLLNLPDDEQLPSPASARGKKAADSRWATHSPRTGRDRK